MLRRVTADDAARAADSSSEPSIPARVLGPIDATCVVVGAIIGVGIFFTPSRVAALTGTGGLALLAWGVAGLIALCGALTFAELGARRHGSGAQYQILREAWGPLPAFLFVFCNATAIQAGAAAIIAIICVSNLAAAVGAGAPGAPALLALSGALIALLAAANIVGVRWGARIQNATVFAKVLTLLAITLLAALAGAAPEGVPAPGAPPAPSPRAGGASGALLGVTAALVPAFFAFGGWQHALWISGEVRDPRRNLPRAIVGGVLLVVLVYLLANWAYLRLLGAPGVAGSAVLAADAADTGLRRLGLRPGAGARLVAAAVAVSAFGVLNAQLLSGPRLVFGMARDGRFFAPFARLSARAGTPVAAILLIAGMAVALLGASHAWELLLAARSPAHVPSASNTLDRLLTGAVFIDGVFFALTGAALFRLRRASGTEPGTRDVSSPSRPGFRVPGYPVVPIVFIVGQLGVVAGAYLDPAVRGAAVIGMAWIAAAGVLYALRFRAR